MNTKSLEELSKAFREIQFREDFDTIVAVANGGIIPAALLNQRLQCDFEVIKISLRDSEQHPMYDAPRLVAPLTFNPAGRKILLVEDRIKTGASIQLAKSLLHTADYVKTFAVNGKADYCLYNETCFRMPWNL